jgi:ABC-type glycerol-3-phosphate transport system permease component
VSTQVAANAPTMRRSALSVSKGNRILTKVVVTVFFVFLATLFFIPFYWMIISSLRPPELIFVEAANFLPTQVTIESYQKLFEQLPYARWFLNSVIMSAGYAVLTLFLCATGGFALATYRFPLRNTIFLAILGSQMIPFHLLLIPLFVIMVNYRLTDTYLGAILPLAAHPFGLFFMRQFMIGISADLLDAARVDGASEYRLFFSIVLPLVKPALSALAILFSMQFWNNLLWPLVVMRSMEKLPLTVGIASLVNQYRPQYDMVMAASFLSAFPIILLFLFMQKQFLAGMAATGVSVEK